MEKKRKGHVKNKLSAVLLMASPPFQVDMCGRTRKTHRHYPWETVDCQHQCLMGQGYGLRKNPFQEVGECEIVCMFNSTALPWFLTLLISVHTAVCSVIFFYSCIFGCPPPSCQGHSSLDAPSELNPPQRIPSPLLLHY